MKNMSSDHSVKGSCTDNDVKGRMNLFTKLHLDSVFGSHLKEARYTILSASKPKNVYTR